LFTQQTNEATIRKSTPVMLVNLLNNLHFTQVGDPCVRLIIDLIQRDCSEIKNLPLQYLPEFEYLREKNKN
jgi:hypothetical protein